MLTAKVEPYWDKKTARSSPNFRGRSEDDFVETDKSFTRQTKRVKKSAFTAYDDDSYTGSVDAKRIKGDVVIGFTDPVTDKEFESLMREQARLARKSVIDNLTHAENLQLRMVRWAIDRVENARLKCDLDRLDKLVTLHEKLAEEISRFSASIDLVRP